MQIHRFSAGSNILRISLKGTQVQCTRLRTTCTFGEACVRICECVPDGDVWILQAPGCVLFVGEDQLKSIKTIKNNTILCLSAFSRGENGWEIKDEPSIHQFAWIGTQSSMLRHVACSARMIDTYACSVFSYCLRKQCNAILINPCYSFVTLRLYIQGGGIEDPGEDPVDVVMDQVYRHPIDNDWAWTISQPDTQTICINRIAPGRNGIPWWTNKETSAFSRLLDRHVSNDFMNVIVSRINDIGKPYEQPDHKIDIEHIRWPRRIHLQTDIICAESIASMTKKYTALRISKLSCLPNTSERLHTSLARLGWPLASSANLGFSPRGSCGGEDLIIADVLRTKCCLVGGIYVDIGCGSEEFSNTHNLSHRAGWSGVCVDVREEAVSEMRLSRPDAICIRAFVSDHDGHDRYISIPENPKMHRFAASPEFEWHRGLHLPVTSVSLWSIVKDILPHTPLIHLLSITCEGEDFNVLSGARLSLWRPLVISILFKSDSQLDKHKSILLPIGYSLVRKLMWIAIFQLLQSSSS